MTTRTLGILSPTLCTCHLNSLMIHPSRYLPSHARPQPASSCQSRCSDTPVTVQLETLLCSLLCKIKSEVVNVISKAPQDPAPPGVHSSPCHLAHTCVPSHKGQQPVLPPSVLCPRLWLQPTLPSPLKVLLQLLLLTKPYPSFGTCLQVTPLPGSHVSPLPSHPLSHSPVVGAPYSVPL